MRKETSDFAKDRDELNEEIAALKHELVKAEEMRTRLESLNETLKVSLNVANVDNAETKEQIETLIQVKRISNGVCTLNALTFIRLHV